MQGACQTYGVDNNNFNVENIRRCERYVNQMQRRLDKALASNEEEKIRWIIHLLSKRSRAVKVLAVYHITVENEGRYTPGIDGESIKKGATHQEKNQQRQELLKGINVDRQPRAVKRVYIEKGNGKKRPLGIPTMQDRITQDIIRITIEPIVEYHFHDNSYGFRPKRRCQDAICHLFRKLAGKGRGQWIVEGDIKGCFDNISQEELIKELRNWGIPRPIIEKLKKILKAKIYYEGKVTNNERGTPQGGVISPILANVALTRLDRYCERYGRVNPIIRYADDFVNVCREEEEAKKIKEEIAEQLKEEIGLTLSEEKTKITHITEGIDFLGFNIRRYKDKLLIKPESSKSQELLKEIKKILKENKTIKPEMIIQKLNPKIQGYGQYYRYVVSKEEFSKIQWKLGESLWRWTRRRHPDKPHKWVKEKYFKNIGSETKLFTDGEGQQILNISKIPIVRYIKVRSGMRVYSSDKQTQQYWEKRATQNVLREVYSERMERLLKRQEARCPYCCQLIEQIEGTHIHHMRPRSKDGKDELNNLRLLHLFCHEELHRVITRKQMKELTDKNIDYVRSYHVQEYLKEVA